MKQLLKTAVFTALICSFWACGNRDTQIVRSPDGNVAITFQLVDGKPFYSVSRNGEVVVKPSALGFVLANDDRFDRDFRIVRTSRNSVDYIWEQVWGEEIYVRNHYNELRVELQENSGQRRKLNLVFRAFNDGIGFRYEFPEQENLNDFIIMAELTEFAMAADHYSWWIYAYQGYFHEMLFNNTPISQMDTVSLPLTMEVRGGGYITIHEANLTDYAALNLFPNGTTLTADLTPWSHGVRVYASTPSVTPWRTMILADDLNQLVNSRIMLNLNEPNQIEDTSWIQPMKYIGIWWGMHMGFYTWAQGPLHGANTANVKRYIDFAATHNIQGVLVEGWNYGWNYDWTQHGYLFNFTQPVPEFDIVALTRYAAYRGVELIGHHETGGWTINYENQLEDAFRFYNEHGIRAVKTGYVTHTFLNNKERHTGQFSVRHQRKVVETAARHQIMLNVHEPVMPTGLQRTFPNLMTHEGFRGAEYDAWSADGGNPPNHTTILPFTRGLAGPMDYTPGTFNFHNPIHPQTRAQTTIPKQLAFFVVLFSPLQMASDTPDNYIGNPAFQFIYDVPADWAQTIILDGRIGHYVVTARKDRNSDDWFIGAITNEYARTITIDFSFLDAGRTYIAQIYRDAPDSHWKTNPYPVIIEEIEITSETVMDFFLAPSGGVAIRIKS